MKVGLIACCGLKARSPRAAKDLYQSALFKRSRAYVEHCDQWGILSAKFGLLNPEQTIEPYDFTLEQMRSETRRMWYALTKREILAKFGECELIVLAGEIYREGLAGLNYLAPMHGLGIGKQLAWLDQANGKVTNELPKR